MNMSYAIGSRIKELRLIRKINQDEMADLLKTTRQRYSRLENGQVDISYVIIKKIAEYFGVSIDEITNAEEEKKELVAFFREENTCQDVVGSVEKIEEILKVFNAHKKLYYQTREKNIYVD
jgi:transcriptional regulator with XRE-family HTH domain